MEPFQCVLATAEDVVKLYCRKKTTTANVRDQSQLLIIFLMTKVFTVHLNMILAALIIISFTLIHGHATEQVCELETILNRVP